MDTLRHSFEASALRLALLGPNKKRSQRLGLNCKGEPIRRSSATGTGEFDWPVDNLAIRSKSQTNLVGKEDSYLCRSRSLFH
jgi:hypothetical protein